jgi:hypothetical protein
VSLCFASENTHRISEKFVTEVSENDIALMTSLIYIYFFSKRLI